MPRRYTIQSLPIAYVSRADERSSSERSSLGQLGLLSLVPFHANLGKCTCA